MTRDNGQNQGQSTFPSIDYCMWITVKMMMTMLKMKTNMTVMTMMTMTRGSGQNQGWSTFPSIDGSLRPPWHSSYFDDKDDNGKMTMTKRQ